MPSVDDTKKKARRTRADRKLPVKPRATASAPDGRERATLLCDFCLGDALKRAVVNQRTKKRICYACMGRISAHLFKALARTTDETIDALNAAVAPFAGGGLPL